MKGIAFCDYYLLYTTKVDGTQQVHLSRHTVRLICMLQVFHDVDITTFETTLERTHP